MQTSSTSVSPEMQPPEQPSPLADMDRTLREVSNLLENDTPRALGLVESIIQQTENVDEPEFKLRRASALQMMSRLAYRHMEFAKAIIYASISLSLYESLDDLKGQHSANFVLGIYHIALADATRAMEYLTRAIECAEATQDYWGIGSACGSMAVLHHKNGQYQRALEVLDYALEMKHKANDRYGQAVVLSNQARTYAALGDFSKAIDLVHQSIALSLEIDSAYLRVSSELILGDVYAEAGQYTQALGQFEECLRVCHEKRWLELEIATVSKVGKAYLGIGEIERAIQILEAGLVTVRQNLSTYTETEILNVLIEAYELQGNYKRAFESLSRLNELQKHQIQEERNARLQSLEQGYQMRLARHEADTQRKRVEEIEIRAEQDRVYFQHLNQLRDEFLSAATHDLKNPLASVRINTHMLRRKLNESSPLLHHVEQIDHQVGRMGDMITDMLELAKLETGRALETCLTSLAHLIDDVVREYQQRAEANGLKLVYQCYVNIDNAFTQLDERLIRRAISNLLSNSIKYSMQKGIVEIRLRQDGAYFVVTVSDQGMGIAPQDLPYIFDRFYRARTTATQNIEGTGLGLSIVKAIVDQHNGNITVESLLGKGTTFQIILPVIRE